MTDEIWIASNQWKHSEAKQFGMRTRVGYISARIIQLGYIQWDVTLLQEYEENVGQLYQKGCKSNQNTFLYRVEVRGMR